MKQELYNYDIFPMVFPVGEATEITVKPLGKHSAFSGDYRIVVQRLDAGSLGYDFAKWNHTDYDVTPCEDGALRFTYTADVECEHFVRIYKDDKRILQLPVYALAEDLACRIPLRGDLHMHTCRSDGREDPATVCANYRKIGYDFIVVTDHNRYYPSLEAQKAYKDADIALNILPGEEVHVPLTNVHIVNAGGTFSVNGLIETSPNYTETNGSIEGRSLDGNAPETMSREAYDKMIAELAASDLCKDCPENVDKTWYAVCCWAFDRIREAGGLAVYAHPYWIADMWHVPEAFNQYILRNHPFDAFEVLGGESYFEQNGFQTAIYYEEYAKGRVHPVVGSTDCHWSCELNRNYDICSTIVFAEKNERKSIITSIKDGYSVAVDTISKEYRLVGEFRLQKYASFLMENYFPIHHSQAQMDGEMMRLYAVNEADAEEVNLISARAEKLMKKFILTK
jgi:hypothetical protein